ncbi:unnamed protein product, partial [Meganyctiphanes norvegica]
MALTTSKMEIKFFLVLLSLVKLIKGACPDVELAADFKTEQYLGVWYEIQGIPSMFQSIKSCFKSTYSLTEDGSIFVESKGLGSGGEPDSTSIKMSISENPARMITDFLSKQINPPYEVLSTDYSSYACVHSCVSVGPITNDFVFIYSREKTLEQDKIDLCRDIFAKYEGTDINGLVSTPQLKPECVAISKPKDEL